MRIATLQLSPRLGDVEGNMRRANALVDNLERRLLKLKREAEREGSGGGVVAGAGAGSAAGLLDVLVLPEMAFTGYNFPSLQAIRPYLEPTESGPTAQWARSTAHRLGCVVCVGYPELAEAGAGLGAGNTSNLEISASASLPSSLRSDTHSAVRSKDRDQPSEDRPINDDRKENKPETDGDMEFTGEGNGNDITTLSDKNNINLNSNSNNNNSNSTNNVDKTNTRASRFNSALIVSPTGSALYNYQKRFLYYTDEPWAAEGRNGTGFLHIQLPSTINSAAIATPTSLNTTTTPTAIGICMDINPYKFLTPWTNYEFATHVLASGARLVLLPMAWLTLLKPAELESSGDRSLAHCPDLETFRYWIMRFWPLVVRRKEGEEGGDEEGKKKEEEEEEEEEEVIIVFANRVGVEEGGFRIGEDGDGVARYAGSSCVVGIRRMGKRDDVSAAAGGGDGDGVSSTRGGKGSGGDRGLSEAEIVVWEMLGRAEEGVCFADTDAEPKMVFRMKVPGDDDEDGDGSS